MTVHSIPPKRTDGYGRPKGLAGISSQIASSHFRVPVLDSNSAGMQELVRQRDDPAASFASVQDFLRSAVEEKRSIMLELQASLEEERVRQGRFLASFAESMRWGLANLHASETHSFRYFSVRAFHHISGSRTSVISGHG